MSDGDIVDDVADGGGVNGVSGGDAPIIRAHAQIRIVDPKAKRESKTQEAIRKAEEKERNKKKTAEEDGDGKEREKLMPFKNDAYP